MCELWLRGTIRCVPIEHGSVGVSSKILAAVRRASTGQVMHSRTVEKNPPKQLQFLSPGVSEPQPEAV